MSDKGEGITTEARRGAVGVYKPTEIKELRDENKQDANRGKYLINIATPVMMRKSLMMADSLKKSMILFIPMPVLDMEDKNKLLDDFEKRIDKIESMLGR